MFCARLKPVSQKQKLTLTTKTNNALCNPKGCESGQSSQRVVSAILVYKYERIYYPRLHIVKMLQGAICSIFLSYPNNVEYVVMKKALTISGICLALLLILFLSTNPTKVPSLVLVVPFVLLFVFLFALTTLFLGHNAFPRGRQLRVSVLCASIPLVLLILQSIGQLTIKDVLTITALFVVSYFYVSRLSTSS